MSYRTRVTGAAVERAAERLSNRDRQIVLELARLRVATGRQLERLAFADLDGRHRDRSRRRELARLVDLGVLTVLDRRIGGVRAGSAGLTFVLDVLGLRLANLLDRQTLDTGVRPRRPGTPTDRFLSHTVAVSELYVQLIEATRRDNARLVRFAAEPACWWQDSEGQWVKPDATFTLQAGDVEDSWAAEIDQATESLPTLRAKLIGYMELAERGDAGPDGVLPRVIVTVPDERRREAVATAIEQLPEPASELLHVVLFKQAVGFLLRVLKE